MLKQYRKKIICVATCAVLTATLALTFPACMRNSIRLDGDFSYDAVISNGGFAVEAGDYIYFVNGQEDNSATNKYGKVEKGAIMRISVENFRAHNYNAYYDESYVETVVPQMFYSTDETAGIYIYGDYIYYCTPSTDRNSTGDILYDSLDFKRTRLDGSESMTGYYYRSDTTSLNYRYVEVDGVVYLMYALQEDYYGIENETTNIHSINTETGDDTVLAYNVSSYSFDTDDRESPVVYYTMDVTKNLGGDGAIALSYNQLYRATADMTDANNEAKGYSFDYIDTDADDYNKDDPIYVNCGDLVFDGLGLLSSDDSESFNLLTQYNYYGEDADAYKDADGAYINEHPDYVYSICGYEKGTLYYSREGSSGAEIMFMLSETDEFVSAIEDRDPENGNRTAWNAVTGNPNYENSAEAISAKNCVFMYDADAAFDYTVLDYIKDGEDETSYRVLYTENNRLLLASVDLEEGKVVGEYCLTDDAETSSPSMMFTDGDYLYYSISGVNDDAIYRIDYTGEDSDYNTLYPDPDVYPDTRSVKILDIEFDSTWFAPELLENQILFSSQTDVMGEYGYIMVCDLTSENGGMMTNDEINALNEQYDDLMDTLDDIDADDYENLTDALKYLFYSRDVDYLQDLRESWVTYQDKKINYMYSDESAQIYLDFFACEDGDMEWSQWLEISKEVNGEEVYGNSRDYYYSLLGKMTDDDYDDYIEELRDTWMTDYAEDEFSWWWHLNLAAKISFIIGMCLCGLIVIAAILVGVYFLDRYLKKRRLAKEEAEETSRNITVDITDDRNVDVYGGGADAGGSGGESGPVPEGESGGTADAEADGGETADEGGSPEEKDT